MLCGSSTFGLLAHNSKWTTDKVGKSRGVLVLDFLSLVKQRVRFTQAQSFGRTDRDQQVRHRRVRFAFR